MTCRELLNVLNLKIKREFADRRTCETIIIPPLICVHSSPAERKIREENMNREVYMVVQKPDGTLRILLY